MEKESEAVGEIETVFSGEFVPEDPKVAPVLPDVPILRMTNGQKITIQAIARLGYGKTHAKWQSSIVTYKYDPIITIDNSKNSNWDEVVKYCPPKILEAKDGKLKVTDMTACILCDLCTEKAPKGSITVESNAKDFIFTLTSLGQMSVIDLLDQGLNMLKLKAEELKEKLGTISVPDT